MTTEFFDIKCELNSIELLCVSVKRCMRKYNVTDDLSLKTIKGVRENAVKSMNVSESE